MDQEYDFDAEEDGFPVEEDDEQTLAHYHPRLRQFEYEDAEEPRPKKRAKLRMEPGDFDPKTRKKLGRPRPKVGKRHRPPDEIDD
ncbi:MAG: hypothetical protein EB075_03110 [Bacteroidetes bacterium]|jgi:hypothetical protein|nr:hypothetical protein [Bacteroidota bacterium]